MFFWRYSENFEAFIFQNTNRRQTSKAHPTQDFIQFLFRHCLLILQLRSEKRQNYLEEKVIISIIHVCQFGLLFPPQTQLFIMDELKGNMELNNYDLTVSLCKDNYTMSYCFTKRIVTLHFHSSFIDSAASIIFLTTL